ncbi:MAG: xanthine dehydrogenase molybdopterin-binding subunit B [Verrucomicrobiales bacterium]|jgi:xanthine dehydrogenase molybdopterin-binding subunit B
MVKIDVLSGHHRILTCIIVQDCGKSLNPLFNSGQAEGGFLQGAMEPWG